MVIQSDDELRDHLREQIHFLKTSAELFDKGNLAEAKRLAVAIRVLLHDTKTSLSLLGQLSLKDRNFLDTTLPRPKTITTSYSGLVGMSLMAGPSEYVPHLGRTTGIPTPFAQWWEAPIIIDMQQREISRRKLVLAVANKDGGAHVDPELDEIYSGVSRANSMGRMRDTGSGWEAMPGLALASVRQIAHEILTTLEPGYHPLQIERPSLVLHGFELGFGPAPQNLAQPKIGRNDPCSCGSGKKFKKCHGK